LPGYVEVEATDLEPPMADVTTLIERDHCEVENVFAKFRQTRDASVATQICEELDCHTDAEETAVYEFQAAKG
jgi:hypothetical protein